MEEIKLAAADPTAEALYETDFFRWTETMAACLRDRDPGALDWDHLAEEIASLGRRDRRELFSRLRVLIAHLLKWQYQPELRGGSTWKATIREQRRQIEDLLEQSPSLRTLLPAAWPALYTQAMEHAADEMKIDSGRLPQSCPFTREQVLDFRFLPE